MRAEAPLAHAETLSGLWRAAAADRLPHALLFEGPSGIGKFLAARHLAMGLVCSAGPGEPCGGCGPCKRVTSGGWRSNHPDVHVVDALREETEKILVGRVAVREGEAGSIEAFLSLRAMEGGWRIVLVREAHRMVIAAQNALLKTLEEPGDQVLLVLETHRHGSLLDTLRSRCVRVEFTRLAAEDAVRLIVAGGVAADEARELARWCGGSPGDALALAARGGIQLRSVVADLVLQRVHGLVGARRALSVEADFAGATPPARERDRARTFLDLALAVSADAGRREAGVPASDLAHGDLLGEGRPAQLDSHAVDALLVARADVERNLGTPALIERSCLVLAGGACVGSGDRG